MLHPGMRNRSSTERWASQALFLGLSSPIMKAAVITRYGSPDVIEIIDVLKPAPAAGEVLIRVHATTVNRTDCGELRPRIIGGSSTGRAGRGAQFSGWISPAWLKPW